MSDIDQPGQLRIYVADLAAYNTGILHGRWIDLDIDTTVDEVREAIRVMLDETPVTPPEIAEEYAIHDYEGFHGYELDEYEALETVVSVATFIAEHGELAAKLVNMSDDVDDARQSLEERYAGSGESLTAWAETYAEDTGQLDEIPERWHPYIDFERYSRDLELGGDINVLNVGGEVHVFWSW